MSDREKRARQYTQNKTELSWGGCLRCFLSTAAAAAGLILIFSALAYAAPDPDRLTDAAAWAALFLTGVGTGGFSVLFSREKAGLCSLLCGGAFLALGLSAALLCGARVSVWTAAGDAAFLGVCFGSSVLLRLFSERRGNRRRHRTIG